MEIPIVLDESLQAPPYVQLASSLKDSIRSGRLKSGDFLPGTPKMAKQLAVARSTVVRAYEVLVREHFAEAISGVGTRVVAIPGGKEKSDRPQVDLSAHISASGSQLLEEGEFATGIPELSRGAPPFDLLPVREWRKTILECNMEQANPQSYGSLALGDMRLRSVICDFLRRSRGVICEPEQVAVFPTALGPLRFLLDIFATPESTMAVEEPAFFCPRNLVRRYGTTITPVQTDKFGITIDSLHALEQPANLLYATPARQDPSAAHAVIDRRRALLNWADSVDALIIEDDYNAQLSYQNKPLPALQGMDQHGRVIYITSLWKLLHPLCSAGIMVVPEALAETMERASEQLVGEGFPLFELQALTRFVETGRLDKHIDKLKTSYRRKLQAVVHSLCLAFGRQVEILSTNSGTRIGIRLLTDRSDEEIMKAAKECDLDLVSTAGFYAQAARGEFLVPFAHLEAATIDSRVSAFAALIRDQVACHSSASVVE